MSTRTEQMKKGFRLYAGRTFDEFFHNDIKKWDNLEIKENKVVEKTGEDFLKENEKWMIENGYLTPEESLKRQEMEVIVNKTILEDIPF